MTQPIKIEGLAQFSRNLKRLDADLPKALRVGLNEVAGVVVGDAKPGVPRRSGRAAGSLRVASTRTKVRVRAGGRRAPYYPWLDFGGRVGRRRSVIRPFISDGRYLYHSYYRKRDSGELMEIMERVLVRVAEQAGIEVD